ncbi:hypothetical protein BDD12DRAFT_982712 [Trichophaea hybrida]|nr:hypothetical protein BDD12DRAFT_982712 [Trichophaea hybrida]
MSFASHFYGLTPLYTPKDIAADVVAVTGLAGHAYGSWRNRQTHIMWLKDFLPNDIKNVRITTYGYNTRLSKNKLDIGQLEDHKRDFISELEIARHEDKTLLESKANQEYRHILDSTYGVMLFGAPIGGLRTSELKEMVKAELEPGDVQEMKIKLLEQLGEESYFPETQRDSLRHISNKFKVLDDGSTKRDGSNAEMVTRHSARLYGPSEITHPVSEDHTNMVKFAVEGDKTYRWVVDDMKKWMKAINKRGRGKRTTIFQMRLWIIIMPLLILLVGHLMGGGRLGLIREYGVSSEGTVLGATFLGFQKNSGVRESSVMPLDAVQAAQNGGSSQPKGMDFVNKFQIPF